MIDSSAKYGLYNPAFTEDLGNVMLGRMVGNTIDDIDDYKIGGISHSMDNIDIKGTLPQDTVELSTKNRKKKVGKTVLAGAAIITAGLLTWKFAGKLKPLATKALNGVKSLGAKIKSILKK